MLAPRSRPPEQRLVVSSSVTGVRVDTDVHPPSGRRQVTTRAPPTHEYFTSSFGSLGSVGAAWAWAVGALRASTDTGTIAATTARCRIFMMFPFVMKWVGPDDHDVLPRPQSLRPWRLRSRRLSRMTFCVVAAVARALRDAQRSWVPQSTSMWTARRPALRS